MSKPTILLSLLLTACITNPGDPCRDCHPEQLTLDGAGFYDAGSRWMSRSSDPMLQGTVLGDQPVHVFVGKTALGAARVANGRWSLRLPAGSITEAGVVVRIEVAVPADDSVETLLQPITLDATITYPTPVFDAPIGQLPATTALGE